MSILVTRPSPAGEQLVSRLRALGQVAWSFPLIEFSPGRELSALADQMNTFQEGDLLFALSQHAVEFAHAQLQQAGTRWPTAPRYFAIGRTTALALHTVSGTDVRYPLDREISEVLLQLPELQTIAGKRALILSGNGGRELLGETLRNAGLTSRLLSATSAVRNTTTVQKRRCAGTRAVLIRWWSPAVKCYNSFGR